ncbi:hypothetical protein R5Y30_006255 [Pseudomonas aeruginosa]|uniref:hypothetical protein n=1 Tax=Pseudomonadota TaxID=1224 RepID=UPI001E5AF56E|nr:hypothetical protein [Comamonas thiooxydans]EIU5421418.1 hypothetical protein [Pseudomonas aeruginosa]ELO1557663.1 hypothetical protein [Aeromonas hydrophila]EIU5421952.1 hypothetical protein [Pseudomonas aeruginosa]EKB9382375.1 hypothetical protein [Pseudomonas aeruginosa]ELS8436010.1 hypothetical protein [Pseudomonas aeruginosa]
MTTEAIIESGMTFGPFAAGECFYVEKSKCYGLIQDGVQMAEFLLLRQKQDHAPVIWVVEAKSSSPRPATQPNFTEFIDEIRAKLTNGFLLGVAALLQRHSEAKKELPHSFNAVNLQSLGFRFVLVINGHKEEWLVSLQDALSLALKPIIKTWALPPTSVVVLNHESAQRHGLILQAAGAVP